MQRTHYQAPSDERALLPYQGAWVNDKSTVKVAVKGRQEGFTWATAYEAVLSAALSESSGGQDVYFMSMSADDARLFVEDCAKWVRVLTPLIQDLVGTSEIETGGQEMVADWFTGDDDDRIMVQRIRFPSGFTIYGMPSRPARLRGKSGVFAIFDEAAQQDISAIKKAGVALTMWGGRIAYISTYFGADNDFFRLVEDIRDDDNPAKGSLHEVFIDEAIRQGLYRRICRKVFRIPWTQEGEDEWLADLVAQYGDFADEELFGIPERSGGQLIPRDLSMRNATLGPDECTVVEIKGGTRGPAQCWVDGSEDPVGVALAPWDGEKSGTPESRTKTMERWLDAHVSPALARITATGLPVHVGIDYGRKANLTTIPIETVGRNNKRKVALVIEMDQIPWPEQDQLLDYLWPRLPRLKAGCSDAGGSGEASSERVKIATRGKVVPINITAGWHEARFPPIQKRLQEGMLALPRHHRPAIDDLGSLRRIKGKIRSPAVTKSKDGRAQRRHADLAYGLALCEQSITLEPAEKKPPPKHRTRRGRIPRGKR